MPRSRYIIIGVHKCGTTSLEKFMRWKGLDVIRQEIIFNKSLDYVRNRIGNRKPVIILRDPIERIWSHYNYKRRDDQKDWFHISTDFETACREDPHLVPDSNYPKFLRELAPLNPIILDLEEMKQNPSFPRETANPHPPMSPAQRLCARQALQKLNA